MNAKEGKTTGTPLNKSVERAIGLLNLFSPDQPELSLGELTSGLGVGKATAHRYAMVLREHGLLRYDSSRGVYTLGPKAVELGSTALAGLRIVKIAGPEMEKLVAEVNETVVLSVWDGKGPAVLRVDDNTDRLVRIVVRTGSRLPLTSAQGKAYCAFSSYVAEPPISQKEIDQIRESGVSVSSDVVDGIAALASPIFQDTEMVAAMAVVGTVAAIDARDDAPIALSLRATTERLTAQLGILTDPPNSEAV